MHWGRTTATQTALAACLLLAVPLARAEESRPSPPLEGKLLQTGRGPALRVRGKNIPLSAVRTWHLNTLKDPRLAGREIRVEGDWAPDGSFKVSQLFTLKGGRLYRVRYYCEVCNIESLEPGDCVCCQAPTELQEIPADP